MASRAHYSLHLPPQADEATFRVGRLAGKTVAVADRNRYFCGSVGLIRKRIPLAEIVAVAPVRNSWLYGWGIHRTPHGWLLPQVGLGGGGNHLGVGPAPAAGDRRAAAAGAGVAGGDEWGWMRDMSATGKTGDVAVRTGSVMFMLP